MPKPANHGMMIPTYVINLKERTDRLIHIQEQFSDKPEFDVSIVDAIKHRVGAIGLWQSIVKIVKMAKQQDQAIILVCEDDHQFAKSYTLKKLRRCIAEADEKGADILLGGVSWFRSALQITNDLFWVDLFSATQFVIIYSKFFDAILETDFGDTDLADYKISDLTNNKLLIYPFISTQKEFGYSDATTQNNQTGHVNRLFKVTLRVLRQQDKVRKFYQPVSATPFNVTDAEYNNITIPTYIINLPERTDRLTHIKAQFKNKPEFDVTIIEACKHEIGAVGLWNSMVKVVNLAIQNDDDVIIICEDDHEFTSHYSRDFLLKNILEAHDQGIDWLSGGSGSFGQAVPLTKERYWVNPLFSTQFIVVYRKLFQQILTYKFRDQDHADMVLSALTIYKTLLCPYISIQKDFGYSDVTKVHQEKKGLVTNLFNESANRLQSVKEAYIRYKQE